MAQIFPSVNSPVFNDSFLTKWVMLQNKNNTVKLLANADIIFTLKATSFVGTNAANILARIIKKGAPAGCPTCSL